MSGLICRGLAVAGLAWTAGCATWDEGGDGWHREVLFDAPARLNGCAVGDVDPESPGPEVVAVDAEGRVFVVRRDGEAWRGDEVARVGGEMLQCAIGDADLVTPGLEIVVVGMREGAEDASQPGQAHLLRRGPDGWEVETLFDDGRLLHAVCVREGEIWVAGFTETAWRLTRGLDTWKAQRAGDLPGAAKSAVAVGDGVAFACTDGSIALVERSGADVTTRIVHQRPAARARLAGADGDLVCADDDGTLSWIDVDTGTAETVLRTRNKLRGAVWADLDPAKPGLEAATAGYGRRVWAACRDGESWKSMRISEEPDRVHHAASGDLHPAPGIEFVTAGFTGQLVMFRAP